MRWRLPWVRDKGGVNLPEFHDDLRRYIDLDLHDSEQVAREFRRLFYRDDDGLGRRVVFTLLSWCRHYDSDAPPSGAAGERWMGQYEIGQRILAAMNAPLDEEPSPVLQSPDPEGDET
jgi:hypothetical protein